MPLKTNKPALWTFDQHLDAPAAPTQVAADGLRYTHKQAGSPFDTLNAFGPSTLSCLLCGKHRPRGRMKSRKLAGKSQLVCEPNCAGLDALLNQP